MESEEFKIFLKKLKQSKITQKAFAAWCGYSQASLICFASDKQKIPLVLARVVNSLEFKQQIGIDLKNIIK